MAVLMLAEVTDGQLQVDATAKAVSAVKGMGDLTLLCCGATCSAAAEEAAKLDGVAKVLCAEHDVYGKRLAERQHPLPVVLYDGIELRPVALVGGHHIDRPCGRLGVLGRSG